MLRSYCKQDALVVALDGELDHFCAQSVRSQLDEMLADSSVRYLVLDFDKSHYPRSRPVLNKEASP